MQRFACLLGAALLSTCAAHAGSPFPVHIERQIGSTLIIEHTPVPGTVRLRAVRRATVVRVHKARRAKVVAVRKVVRRKKLWRARYSSAGLAGGCHDGGHVRRALPNGAVVLLHRDVCEGIAPISSLPR